MTLEVKYVTNSWQASEPKAATPGSAGYDLYAAESKIVMPRSSTPISLHLEIEIPKGFCGRAFPRSSLARYDFVGIGGGVVDSDFWGKIMAILFNHSSEPYEVNVGNRIAQIIFQRYQNAVFVKTDELSKTHRGKRYFGSTGI